jgi:hypothetical protein
MFNFANLDQRTRSLMIDAVEEASRSGQMLYSPRLNDAGLMQWADLLKQAARSHDEGWLAEQVESNELLKGLEVGRRPRGGYSVRHVPQTASHTVAENQFNRFYMLALCRRARSDGIPELEVYRAAERSSPRPESEAMVGTRIPVDSLEAELLDAEASTDSPLLQPNSGLSVRIPESQ